ncbi:uncharacterized protein LOC131595358 isoform X2 [Vicia villosa]|uniref:uncharacterized protein LOC131595358 isoform X2 n=1 Tax=Vicia villosa TaxID=3911 RepID=UPI00273B089A|nr:uncharacterized protein LOC131595358 isoform X2 [Vicia villosa]
MKKTMAAVPHLGNGWKEPDLKGVEWKSLRESPKNQGFCDVKNESSNKNLQSAEVTVVSGGGKLFRMLLRYLFIYCALSEKSLERDWQSEPERWHRLYFGPFDGILCSSLTCQSCLSQGPACVAAVVLLCFCHLRFFFFCCRIGCFKSNREGKASRKCICSGIPFAAQPK